MTEVIVLEIIISNNTSLPIYEQITSQIKEMIINKELQAGDLLPSIRKLAKSVQVSVMTVQKSYDDLQRQGYIETTSGRGSFVAARNDIFFLEEEQKELEKHLEIIVELSRKRNISFEKLLELLDVFYNGG